MTTFTKATLATFFQTGDVPDGTDYANLIDSQVNIAETSTQAMQGSLSMTELIAARVSAGNGNFTGTLSAATFSLDTITTNSIATSALTGTFGSFAGALSANSLTVTADISANTVYASAVRTGPVYRNVAVVSATGTTQATAAPLTLVGVALLKGIVDGTTTGFTLLANQTGLQQTIWVDENTSCNLFPCIGGQINALASNAAFGMAGKTQYIVTHIRASGYSVK